MASMCCAGSGETRRVDGWTVLHRAVSDQRTLNADSPAQRSNRRSRGTREIDQISFAPLGLTLLCNRQVRSTVAVPQVGKQRLENEHVLFGLFGGGRSRGPATVGRAWARC